MASGVGGRRRRRATAWLAAAGAGTLLVLGGCSSGDGEGEGAGGAAAGEPAPQSADAAGTAPATGSRPGEAAAGADRSGTGGQTASIRVDQPALIRTAELTVRVDDVPAQARVAQGYARAAGGSVAGDSRSGSGDEARADLVLKVQPGRLDGVLDQLGGLGEELQRTSSSEDVTETVADLDSRVATMQASIARVRAILSRATRIGDVVAVEGELSRRVTELESLQARQRALAGRVELATVTVHLVAAREAAPPVDRAGFLGGLSDGWTAFTRTVGWLLTVLGAVLPFLIVLLPAAVAVRWAARRPRRLPAAGPGPGPAPDPPPASLAVGGLRVDELDHPGEHVRVGLRQHAVAEVEDVPGGGPALGQHPAHLPLHHRPAGEQQRRVEVALQGAVRTDPAGRLVQRHPPVHPHHVRAGLRQQPQQLPGADPEVDLGYVQVGQCRQHGRAVRQHVPPVVRRRQRAGPGVEQLDRGGAGADLDPQEGRGDARQPLQQRRATAPGRRASAPWSRRGPSTGRPRPGSSPA